MTDLVREPLDPIPGEPVLEEVQPRRAGGSSVPSRLTAPLGPIRAGVGGIAAVGVKELRGRMRGRRAFVILTLYLVFLAGFAWAWQLIAERAYTASTTSFGGSTVFASAFVGQEIFGALLVIETLLVVFLAPAFTAGAISLEREKQTLDMLTATPISSLAIVVGKLLSALTYVFVLIGASIPLTAMVFVFGGVGPDEVLRGYIVLLASALGLGSLGLFISAVMQRTQAATVVTFFTVLALTLGTLFVVLFWTTMSGYSSGAVFRTDQGIGPIRGRPPDSLLWFNPFAAQYDVICGASDGYGGWCSRLADVTEGAISIGIGGGSTVTIEPGFDTGGSVPPLAVPAPDVPLDAIGQREKVLRVDPGLVFGGPVDVLPGQAEAPLEGDRDIAVNDVVVQAEPQPFGIRRDTFWPRSVAAWLVLSVVLIVASVQLVSPTRRWRLPLPSRIFRRNA